MRIDPKAIPEHLKKLMKPEDRKALGDAGRTVAEVVADHDPKAEIALQGEIAQYLRINEIEFIWPDPRKKSRLPIGWPDFTFAFHGVPMALEVKTPIGVVRPEQIEMHAKMQANGWRVHVVRSLPEVQAVLRGVLTARAVS
jgi:hypothetical protein